jgi:hypothetical protein
MALESAYIGDIDRGVADTGRTVAAWMSGILLISLTLWGTSQDGALKYIIYTLPLTLTSAYLVINEWHWRVHRPAAVSLALYLACAATSVVVNASFDFFAIRDVAIVSGYLLLFALWFRAPAWTADIALLALTLGMIAEAATTGLGKEVNWFGSDGILESALAFPIGAVTLYFLHTGRWGRALMAFVLLFLAFKRIAFLGVAIAVGFDLVLGRFIRQGAARTIALTVVITLSAAALFSAQLFELVSSTLDLEQTSANSISLGRYDIATRLWQDIVPGPLGKWLIGFGPGAADSVVTATTAGTLTNAHNDWLKILYDYGVIGLVVMHIVLFHTLTGHRLGVMLYLYGATVMMTDNILIYMFYHPFVMLMIATSRR